MPFWDFFEDEVLIVGAYCHTFQKSVNEFYEMSYFEFYMLLPEILGTETAFANLVRNRRETNKERIKNFTPDQKADYDKWQAKARKWDIEEEKRLQAWRNENADLIKAKQEEIENKKKIARERLNRMLNS